MEIINVKLINLSDYSLKRISKKTSIKYSTLVYYNQKGFENMPFIDVIKLHKAGYIDINKCIDSTNFVLNFD